MEIYYLTDLEASSVRSRHWQGHEVPLKALEEELVQVSLLASGTFLTVAA